MGFRPDDTYTAELQTVLRTAHALKDTAGASHSLSLSRLSPTAASLHAIIDSITLPSPCPLLPALLKAGFCHENATEINQTYRLRAEELRQRIQETLITTCRGIAELPVVALGPSPDLLIRKVVFTLTELYLHRIEQWKEEIIQRIKQAPKTPTKVNSRNSRAFNQRCVPLLEHFFEQNPFPTQADKIFLAEKSNMEYRQIHVWFQNRRNRTKKEGKRLGKQPTYERATEPLDKLYKDFKGHMVYSDPQAPELSETGLLEGTTENNISKDAFTSSSPPHAFPTSYPPTCHYEPFPCKSGPVCFSEPEWRRVPDRKHPLSVSTSIDDLVGMFSRLNVRDGTRPKGSPKLRSHAATVAITVIPSRAPHPSLIIRKYSQPANIVQLRPSVSTPVSCPKAFQSPSPTSKPITLVPLSAPPKLPEKRKTAPLPRRRLPGRMQSVCRDTTPSESSSTSFPSPRLDSESRSPSFSSISLLSTPPDAASIQELPNLFGSPCRSPFDSPIHLRGLGDMIAISPSSVS